MSEYTREQEYREVPTKRYKASANWSWLLLLPLFFITGWFANDAINGPYQNDGTLRPGIGGGPEASYSPIPNSDSYYNNDTRNNTYPDNGTVPQGAPVATVLPEVSFEPTEAPRVTIIPRATAEPTETPEVASPTP
jgi:hypothetical protein